MNTFIPENKKHLFENANRQVCFMEFGGMTVATNRDTRYGAAVVLNEDFPSIAHKRLGGDFYIIPSSVHEVICLPCEEFAGNELELLFLNAKINNDENIMHEDEVLTTGIWKCDGKTIEQVA